MDVQWLECVLTVSPLVKVLREKFFQLQTSIHVQIIEAGGDTLEGNAGDKNTKTTIYEKNCSLYYQLSRRSNKSLPLECLKTGTQLVKLRFLSVLHTVVEELTNSVQFFIAQVAIRSEVERHRRELNKNSTTTATCN